MTIAFADPITLGPGSDRKAVTAASERTARALAAAAITGRAPLTSVCQGRPAGCCAVQRGAGIGSPPRRTAGGGGVGIRWPILAVP